MNLVNKIDNNKLLYISLALLTFSLPLIEVLKQITMVLIIIYGLYYLYKNKISLKKDILVYSFLGLVVSFIFSAILNSNTIEILDSSKYLFRLFFVFLVLYSFNYASLTIKKIICFMLFGYVLSLIWGYYDFIMADFDRMVLKLHSVGHINHSSIYMLYIFIILISYILYNKTTNIKETLIMSLLLFITLATIYITSSRATMYTSIGILAILTIYSVLITKNYKIFYMLTILPLIIYFILNSNSLSEVKFIRGFQDSARLELILSGIKGWYESGNYLFGLGTGNYNFHNHSHAHNTYINLLAENGLFGLGFYILLMFSIGIKLFNRLKENKNSYILISAMLLWIANMVLSFANTTFHHENALLLTIFWIFAINTELKEKKI